MVSDVSSFWNFLLSMVTELNIFCDRHIDMQLFVVFKIADLAEEVFKSNEIKQIVDREKSIFSRTLKMNLPRHI